AKSACIKGACGLGPCVMPFGDCNLNAADGCEIDLTSSPGNCSACGKVCAAVANGTPGCAASVCGIGMCNGGFKDCKNGAADGCETDLTSGPGNCWACGMVCPAVANATPGCAASVCGIGMCNGGFKDCKNGAADGCETNVTNTVANCGAC